MTDPDALRPHGPPSRLPVPEALGHPTPRASPRRLAWTRGGRRCQAPAARGPSRCRADRRARHRNGPTPPWRTRVPMREARWIDRLPPARAAWPRMRAAGAGQHVPDRTGPHAPVERGRDARRMRRDCTKAHAPVGRGHAGGGGRGHPCSSVFICGSSCLADAHGPADGPHAPVVGLPLPWVRFAAQAPQSSTLVRFATQARKGRGDVVSARSLVLMPMGLIPGSGPRTAMTQEATPLPIAKCDSPGGRAEFPCQIHCVLLG
jgi:hypothetical protein